MNFQENFQNVTEYDSIDLDNIEKFEVMEEEDVKKEEDVEGEDVEREDVEGEDVEGKDVEGEDVKKEREGEREGGKNTFSDLNNIFKKSNPDIKGIESIEGFKGGEEKKYNDNKLVLKSILFGLLFYILSNQKIYNLTRPYLNGLDKNLVHSIVFIILFYLINIVI
jgi:hypothetical protein